MPTVPSFSFIIKHLLQEDTKKEVELLMPSPVGLKGVLLQKL